MAVTDADMPQLFQAADTASLEGQRQYLAGTRLRLVLIVLAAACGLHAVRVGRGDVDIFGLAALLLFVGALLVEIYLWSQHPERAWYDGRALAESVKTLTWKYAVGGDPFAIDLASEDVERDFVAILNQLKDRYKNLLLSPIEGEFITDWMRAMRGSGADERRSAYIVDRVQDQQQWYSKKANENKTSARRWKIGLLALEFGGAVVALLESLTDIPLYITPTIAAAVGAVVAWLETKQHDQLARAYATTVSDLGSALTKLRMATSEDDWAREMNDAEDGISREHTLWLASRSQA